MSASPGSTVTLHVWRLPTDSTRAARSLAAVGELVGTGATQARHAGAEFAVALGTADSSFTVRGATLSRWALLTSWTDHDQIDRFARRGVVRRMDSAATEHAVLHLRPLSVKGHWAGRNPWSAPASSRWDGPVVTVTHARLRAGRTAAFRAQSPRVAAEVVGRAGLLTTFGIGERPQRRVGTVSAWTSHAAMRAFLDSSAAHQTAVRRVDEERWYAEDLFSTLALEQAHGTLDNHDVSTWIPS